MEERKMIYLCLAHMSEDGAEQKYVKEAFDTNWVVPMGPNVTAFEKELEQFVGSLSQPSPKGKGVYTADPMMYDLLKTYAEENRKNPTEAESVLWKALKAKGNGAKFRRQHIIGDFIVDFFCNEANLVIELDGGYHNMPVQMKSDAERTAALKAMGYTELRFKNEEVICNIEAVLKTIKTFADIKSSPLGEDLGEAPKVVCLSAGTAAVHLALIACGVKAGDEVLVQSFTFCASSHPITYLGAKPIFVGSEAETWNMDPVLLEEAIKDRIAQTGRKPKAIIPVALYGMPYDCEKIMAIANKYEIPVIEDAAEGMGSRFDGRVLGTFGRFGVLSFNGNKMITTSGGGALICNGAHPSLSQPSPKGEDFVGVHSANPMLYGILKDFAKEHRNNPTEAESILWEMLRGKGLDYKFRRQHIIGDCIADFFCCENNLCIELDGGYHNVPAQIKRDDERTKYLQERGCIEIRFTNEEVIANTEHVLEVIKRFCDVLPNLKSFPSGEDLGEATPQSDANEIMWYATQARDAYPYYEHTAIGYNYRMSNVCAGIGRGQMTVLDAHIAHHKHVQELYKELLKDVKGVTLHEQPDDPRYDSNFWLCAATLDEDVHVVGQENAYKEVITSAVGGAAGVIKQVESATTDCQPNDNVEALRVFMLSKKVECRPLWKPMHKQPVYTGAPSNLLLKGEAIKSFPSGEDLGEAIYRQTSDKSVAYTKGVEEELFKVGFCLPAGPYVTDDDVRYIVECIKEAIA